MGCYFLMGIIRLSITPSAKRNTLPFRVAKRRAGDFGSALLSFYGSTPRVEALRTSTLGWGNATPTELPRVRTACYGLTIHCSRERAIHIRITIHCSRERTIHIGLTIHCSRERAIHLGLTIHCSRERTIYLGLTIHYSRERAINLGITIHCSRERTSHLGLTTHGRWERAIYDALLITNALINMEYDEGG